MLFVQQEFKLLNLLTSLHILSLVLTLFCSQNHKLDLPNGSLVSKMRVNEHKDSGSRERTL
jgi:hypothetical protein